MKFNELIKSKNNRILISIMGIALVMILVGVVFNFIGGGTTLTCSNSFEAYGMLAEDQAKIYFKNDEVTKVTLTIKTTLSDDSLLTLDALKESVESQKEEYEEDGIEAKISNNKDSVILTVIYKESDVEEVLGSYLEDDMYSYDGLKQYYEDQGYTCE